MNIRINSKKVSIKTADNLSCSEYLKFLKLSSKAKNSAFDYVVNYLSIITEYTLSDVLQANISNNDILRIFQYIGNVKSIKEVTEKKCYYSKACGNKVLYRHNQNWQSVGVRLLISNKNIESDIEFCAYLIAIFIDGKYDNENIEKIYKKVMQSSYIDVYAFAAFFLKKLRHGLRPETAFLRLLRKVRFLNILKLLNRLRGKN